MAAPNYHHAIVVGASSGLGAALVRRLAESGCRVAAIARREDRLAELAAKYPRQVVTYTHDVRNHAEAAALFAQATGDLGGLDLIIYAAGVMPDVGPAEYSIEKDVDIFETNIVGALVWLDLAAQRFSNTHAGTIVGIGSVAGDRGRCAQPAYNASKAALATYLEALRNRLSRLGVRVVTIKPGPIATEMTEHLHMRGMMKVDEAARRTLALSGRTGEHYLKWAHRLAFYVIKRVPSPIFRKLKI